MLFIPYRISECPVWYETYVVELRNVCVYYLSIFAPCPKRVGVGPKRVGSMNKISPSIPILSIPISLEEGAASNDIIFPSLPWSSLSVGSRDHFHKNAFEKTHVAYSANMTKPGHLWFSNASKDPLGFKFAGGTSSLRILPGDVKNLPIATLLASLGHSF